MQQRIFNLSELQEYFAGGRINAAFLKELKHVVLDMQDRPHVPGKRSITMQVFFEPVMDSETKELVTTKLKFRFKHAMPDRESLEFALAVRDNGDLIYQPDARDNPDQMTLLDNDVPTNDPEAVAGKVSADVG